MRCVGQPGVEHVDAVDLHLDLIGLSIRASCIEDVDVGFAEDREWLIANGLGSYGCGTGAGSLTRSYHGLLVTALEEVAEVGRRSYPLATHRWAGGIVAPAGHPWIVSFCLEGSVPTWRYAPGDALLEKRIWMRPGAHTTTVHDRLLQASEPVRLSLAPLVNCRSHHGGPHLELGLCPHGGGGARPAQPGRPSAGPAPHGLPQPRAAHPHGGGEHGGRAGAGWGVGVAAAPGPRRGAAGAVAGGPGSQLTWMDAKVNGEVITPRIGKPVEVKALWFCALRSRAQFAAVCGASGAACTALAEAARQGFQRFWNPAAGCCFDVWMAPMAAQARRCGPTSCWRWR